MFNKSLFQFDESGAGGGSAPAPASDAAGQGEGELTFDKWIASQDESVKGLLDGHTKGLKSALDAERESRKTFEKQIRELSGKAEKGSEAEKQLLALSEQIETENRKSAFYEEAHAAGVTNLKLAFMAASTEGLFDKKGNVNFVEMKSKYPELFGVKKAPAGNAGDGTQGAAPLANMNDAIRRMAGKT